MSVSQRLVGHTQAVCITVCASTCPSLQIYATVSSFDAGRPDQSVSTGSAPQLINCCLTPGPVAAGVEGIDLLMSKDFPGQNRGFAFVAFYNHACANAAKNTLSAPTFRSASICGATGYA